MSAAAASAAAKSEASAEPAINKIYFSMIGKWDESEITDKEQKLLLGKPSGLGKVTIESGASLFDPMSPKVIDFTGTTNLEAIMKLRKYYNTPSVREMLGDHVFFEGMRQDKSDPNVYFISFGS